jgi:hypothetical protein
VFEREWDCVEERENVFKEVESKRKEIMCKREERERNRERERESVKGWRERENVLN